MRFLLANLFSGPITCSQQVEDIIPDVHKYAIDRDVLQRNGVFFFKTHWKFDTVSSLPVATTGAIYIYRNPLDIIVSHINYFRFFHDSTKMHKFIEQFIDTGGAPIWLKFNMGTWIENIESWVFRPKNFPCLFLRYESLKTDTRDSVLRICNFLGIGKTNEEITAAIEGSSFGKLRTMEEEELRQGQQGFFQSEHEHKKDPGYRFMYKGSVGSYKQCLTKNQLNRAIEKFGSCMVKLGYQVESLQTEEG